MKRSTMLPALAVLTATLTTTAACQSGAAATGATPAPGAPASASAAQPAPPPDATTPTSQPPPTTAGSGGGGELCQLHGTVLSPDEPDPQQVLRTWQQIYAAAPAEIKPDVHTILDAVTSVIKGEIPADQIDQRLADPTLLAAFQRYAQYLAAHCGDATGLPTR
jgi:hypothetical protein